MAKLLEIYKKKESIHTEIKNINQVLFRVDSAIEKQNISWEF